MGSGFAAVLLGGGALLGLLAGCFHERSFAMRAGDFLPPAVRVADAEAAEVRSTREWLRHTHAHLRKLLPNQRRPVLLTEEMTDAAGAPIDVYAHFDRDVNKMQGLTSNWWALQHTAQSIEQGYFIENPAELYPGFEDVWIPVADDVKLHGFLGLSCGPDGRPRDADCIVILSGLWGDNGAVRNRDLCGALIERGFHALTLEQRGAGQTERRYPNAYFNYGVVETQDMMKVSEWLEDNYPQIRGSGLIGFCWGANQALLAAWYDGRSPGDASISPYLERYLDPISPRRHFTAGVLAFSPVLRWEDFLDQMDTPKTIWKDPSPAMFQQTTVDHMVRKAFPEISGSLRRSIAYDFAYSFGPAFPLMEGYDFLRLLAYRGKPDGDKLERARIPVLIVHSVNDPLQTAQEIVDFIAQTQNPHVASIILPGGGHIGFQAYARSYFYSLIFNFFDPQYGAAAATMRNRPVEARAGA